MEPVCATDWSIHRGGVQLLPLVIGCFQGKWPITVQFPRRSLWMTFQELLLSPHVAQRRRRKHRYSFIAVEVSNKTENTEFNQQLVQHCNNRKFVCRFMYQVRIIRSAVFFVCAFVWSHERSIGISVRPATVIPSQRLWCVCPAREISFCWYIHLDNPQKCGMDNAYRQLTPGRHFTGGNKRLIVDGTARLVRHREVLR